ncbi:MAG: SsrA-binding protein [marine bacterium B5-7]|nr:MAG: SsrA-binding protein [marine bacterium B5-7]
MTKKNRKKTLSSSDIAVNRKARFNYAIEDTMEAGLVLQGWEVKSLRAGHAQLSESYISIKRNEAWLIGSHVTPLKTASTHIKPDPIRERKLLLHRHQINQLLGLAKQAGYTMVPLKLYWHKGRAKCLVGYAKGKKQHDKRETLKQRDWDRSKQRILRGR